MEYYFDYVADADGLLDRLESWDNIDIDAWLEQVQGSREEQLEQELEVIHEQLEQRDGLHRELVTELERKLEWYVDRLEKLYSQGIGKHDGTRERLQDRIEAFYQELRREQREHWQDRQSLERERRDVLRELEDSTDDLLAELL